MNRMYGYMLGMCVALGALSLTATADDTASARVYAPLATRVRLLDARLAALSPDRPGEYLLLGEEVASEASSSADRRLARELLVLAVSLDSRAAKPPAPGASRSQDAATGASKSSIGASACLALAELADSDQDRRWLMAIASALGADLGIDPAPVTATVASRETGAFELATVLGLSRSGEGSRAARLLKKPGVEDLLQRFDKILKPYLGGGADAVRKSIDDWPVCPRCRNRHAVKEGNVLVLCPMCNGTPGPDLSAEDLENHLRAESLLLSGVQRSWSAQIVTDEGAPLRDLDPAEIAAAYAIDVQRPLWRDARWTREPVKPVPAADPNAASPTSEPASATP